MGTTRLGFISDPLMVLHETGQRHPERPDRLRAVHRALRLSGLLTSADPFPAFKLEVGELPQASTPMIELPYHPATDDDIQLIHSAEHIRHVKDVCARGEGLLDAGDTPVSGRSEELARCATGAAISAVDAVMKGEVDRCFVAARPPGHHAEPEKAMGFCLYCHMAIAARHAVVRHKLSRVAIVDFDVHHGNGTQACLEADPSKLFISIHQHPQTCYPGTGFEWEIGLAPAKGLVVNVPLPPTAGDKTYTTAFEEKILPKLDAFKPELLLLSAGFDAHKEDPLADMEVTEEGFGHLTEMLVGSAKRHCGGKIVSLLEGGYNLKSLSRSVVRHLLALQA